jgi:hypothetical protein
MMESETTFDTPYEAADEIVHILDKREFDAVVEEWDCSKLLPSQRRRRSVIDAKYRQMRIHFPALTYPL